MKYGNVEFKIKKGSLSFQWTNRTEVREYPGKDTADFFDLGKNATRISMTAVAESESEKILLLSLFHTPVKRDLVIQSIGEYYKNVIPNSQFSGEPWEDTDLGIYMIPVKLIALDPRPYDVDTGEVMY